MANFHLHSIITKNQRKPWGGVGYNLSKLEAGKQGTLEAGDH